MLEKHQRIKCTSTSFMCTGTPCSKSGSGQSVPVHPKSVPVHLIRKSTVAKVYRYTCMRSAGMEHNCDPNAGAYLSIILEHEMALERSIKSKGWRERGVFLTSRVRFS